MVFRTPCVHQQKYKFNKYSPRSKLGDDLCWEQLTNNVHISRAVRSAARTGGCHCGEAGFREAKGLAQGGTACQCERSQDENPASWFQVQDFLPGPITSAAETMLSFPRGPSATCSGELWVEGQRKGQDKLPGCASPPLGSPHSLPMAPSLSLLSGPFSATSPSRSFWVFWPMILSPHTLLYPMANANSPKSKAGGCPDAKLPNAPHPII